MNLIDRMLKRTPAPAPAGRTFVVPTERPFVNTPALDEFGLRTGMWVTSSSGLGLLTGCRLDGLAEVTLQKSDGSTRMELNANDQAVPAVVVCLPSALRAAYIEEIPTTRHEGADHLRTFGYISASEA